MNGGSTAIGTTVQQYTSSDGVAQEFTLVPDGANWRIAMTADLSKCVDLAGSGSATANGTRLAIAACTAGDASQTVDDDRGCDDGRLLLQEHPSGPLPGRERGNTAAGWPMQTVGLQQRREPEVEHQRLLEPLR